MCPELFLFLCFYLVNVVFASHSSSSASHHTIAALHNPPTYHSPDILILGPIYRTSSHCNSWECNPPRRFTQTQKFPTKSPRSHKMSLEKTGMNSNQNQKSNNVTITNIIKQTTLIDMKKTWVVIKHRRVRESVKVGRSINTPTGLDGR